MQGKEIILALTLIAAAAVLYSQKGSAPHTSEFQLWKQNFGIVFNTQFEEDYRRRVFSENVKKIEEHNANAFKTYEMGVNQFTHLTQEEFAHQYLGLLPTQPRNLVLEVEELTNLGDVDWTTEGAVTGVKNQGQCGSCWAFSTTGGLEGLSKLAYGALESFSEQQLVDCSGSYGNQACNGGLMDNAFKFVKDHGIVHESEYEYKAVKQACKTPSGPFKISGYTDIKNCNDLATGLAGRPISVAVDATNWSPYKSGVFNNCKAQLNHGVTLIGMTDAYWKVKNSWGAAWGESGFIRLAKGNTCGICTAASYPLK